MPPLHRYLGNPVLSFVGRLFFRIKTGDFHCGLRGFNTESIRKLDLQTTGMEFASEMVVRGALAGLRIEKCRPSSSPTAAAGRRISGLARRVAAPEVPAGLQSALDVLHTGHGARRPWHAVCGAAGVRAAAARDRQSVARPQHLRRRLFHGRHRRPAHHFWRHFALLCRDNRDSAAKPTFRLADQNHQHRSSSPPMPASVSPAVCCSSPMPWRAGRISASVR